MAKSISNKQNASKDSPLDHDKLFAKIMSKERYNSSKQGEASFRVLYYGGGAGSIPFLWESQPGTPKHASQDNAPPPLTPPPSYKLSPKPNSSEKKIFKNSKFFNSIFPTKKINFSPSSSSSSSFSSSYSLPSSLYNTRKSYKARLVTVVRFGLDEDENDRHGERSPTSTLCLNGSSLRKSSRGNYFYYPIKSLKKVVLSIVGHSNGN